MGIKCQAMARQSPSRILIPRAFFAPIAALLSLTLPAALVAGDGGSPKITQISDGASFYSSVVAPGSIASIFGTGLAMTTKNADALPLPTTLAGAKVVICHDLYVCEDAPLFYASPNQINLLIPPDFNIGGYTGLQFTVSVNGIQDADSAAGSPAGAALYRIQPEAFEIGYDCWLQEYSPDCNLTWTPKSTQPLRAAVTDKKGHPVTSKNPARIGPTYTLWLTGMGVDPIIKSDVSMGISVPAYGYSGEANAGLIVDFAGPSPQYVGLYQINFHIPPSILGTTGPTAYPPLWPCGEYRWDQTYGIEQQGQWDIPNMQNPVNLPILIEPEDAPCAK